MEYLRSLIDDIEATEEGVDKVTVERMEIFQDNQAVKSYWLKLGGIYMSDEEMERRHNRMREMLKHVKCEDKTVPSWANNVFQFFHTITTSTPLILPTFNVDVGLP